MSAVGAKEEGGRPEKKVGLARGVEMKFVIISFTGLGLKKVRFLRIVVGKEC